MTMSKTRATWVLMAAVALASAPARAGSSAKVANGMKLVIEDRALYVVRGKLRAPLGETTEGSELLDVRVDRAHHTVAVDVPDCAAGRTLTYTFDQLESRLVLAAGKPERALALDPDDHDAAWALARARLRAGNAPEAARALAPLAAASPIPTYLAIRRDQELAPLLDQPALGALRSGAPGDVRFADDGSIVGGIAYSADRHAFAIVDQVGSLSCAVTSDVMLVDAATGAWRASLSALQASDGGPDLCDEHRPPPTAAEQAAVIARARELEAILRPLGFRAIGTEAGRVSEAPSGHPVARFPAHKLGVSTDRSTANLLRGNAVLASGAGGQDIAGAWYVDELGAAVVVLHTAGSESCGPDPYVDVTILRAPPAQ
jgi:hypothetical protein